MALTTTTSVGGKNPQMPMCDECRKRVPRVIVTEMHRQLCDGCAPKKLVLGYPVTEE